MTSIDSMPTWLPGLKRGHREGRRTENLLLPRALRERIEKLWTAGYNARAPQLPPHDDWLTWLILGGRGSGKTRAGAEWVRGIATGNGSFGAPVKGPIALVGETLADALEVMIEGVSGLLQAHEDRERPQWVSSRRMLHWPKTGAVAYAFSSEDPESLRGPQFAAAWADGVGHTAAAGLPIPVAGMTVTRAEAFEILARDLPKYERRTERALSGGGAAGAAGFPQHLFDGAVSFDFNTGAIDRASWVAAFRSGDTATARSRLMLWIKAGGKTVAGLVNRREAEAGLIFGGDYGRTAGAGSQPARGIVLPTVARPLPAIQADLAALGFYRGPIDGIAGPATQAAVVAYQESHASLVADGIVGPATLASLARDIAARKRLGEAVGAAIGAAATSGGAAIAAGTGRPLIVAAVVGFAVLVAVGGFLALRYRDELGRMLFKTKGT